MLISLRNGMLAGGSAPKVNAVCFENVGSTAGTVTLSHGNSAPPLDLQQSTDCASWTTFDQSNGATVPAGGKVYIRAGLTGNVAFSGYSSNSTLDERCRNRIICSSSATFKASGNIMYLLKQDGVASITDNCFRFLFYSSYGLRDASELQLPADALALRCYQNMFSYTYLSAAPVLPAMGLADSCYQNMFKECSKLSSAPELPATTLAANCYSGMFQKSKLTSAPTLPAMTLAENCYKQMFFTCANLTSIAVNFIEFNPSSATADWLRYTSSTGTFTCPAALGTNETITRGYNNCPDNWTVVNT